MTKHLIPGAIALCTVLGFLTSSVQASETIFCSNDAEILLGDICVDAQGRIPDNADIRNVIIQTCQTRPYFVNRNRTVSASFSPFWNEYRFCSIQPITGGQLYYFRVGYDNNRIYRYNTENESWGRLDIWEYATSTGYLRGQYTTFTLNGRALSNPTRDDLEVVEMYAVLADLLAVQSLSPQDMRSLQNW